MFWEPSGWIWCRSDYFCVDKSQTYGRGVTPYFNTPSQPQPLLKTQNTGHQVTQLIYCHGNNKFNRQGLSDVSIWLFVFAIELIMIHHCRFHPSVTLCMGNITTFTLLFYNPNLKPGHTPSTYMKSQDFDNSPLPESHPDQFKSRSIKICRSLINYGGCKWPKQGQDLVFNQRCLTSLFFVEHGV